MVSSQDTVAALAKSIAGLPELGPVERAKRARALSDEAKTVLSAVGDDAVVEALASATYAEVAEAMQVSPSAVNKATTRSRARQRGHIST